MYNGNLYEKRRLRDRFKDIFTLAAFTLAVAVISVAVMNLLIYPLTVFAVNHKSAFNFIVKDLSIFIIVAIFIFFILLKIRNLRKDGLSANEILRYLIRKPVYYFSIFLFFMLTSSVLVFLLYVLLSNNYFLLYKFTNS
jgi:hypothetical protein